MKRITWFVTGLAAGADRRQLRDQEGQADGIAARAGQRRQGCRRPRSSSVGAQVVDAVREGRAAMHAREDELKARRDARVETLDDHLEPGDRAARRRSTGRHRLA